MSITTEPIRVVDRNTAARIINAVIMKYYIEHDGHKDWVYDAMDELEEDFSIKLGEASIRQFLVGLKKKGRRDARAASCFNGKIFTRAEKEGMYRELDALIDLALHGRALNYVGLPANQIVHVARKYDSVVACERDKKMFAFLGELQKRFVPNENVELIRGDVLDYLQTGSQKFSVFDIDLMTYINTTNLLDRLASGIAASIDSRAVVCLVTCYGRKISKRRYAELMPKSLISKLEDLGVHTKYSKSGEYVDQIVPMKYEFLVVER